METFFNSLGLSWLPNRTSLPSTLLLQQAVRVNRQTVSSVHHQQAVLRHAALGDP